MLIVLFRAAYFHIFITPATFPSLVLKKQGPAFIVVGGFVGIVAASLFIIHAF
jgi:hypothetical protein